MTLLGGLFGEKAALPAVHDDIITSDRLLSSLSEMGGWLSLDNDYSASYEEIARKQLWVRIAVNKLAYTLGRLPLKTYERGDGSSRTQARDSELADLLRRPNSTKETGSAAGFQARLAYDLFVYGNAIVVKGQRRRDQPADSLAPVSPRGWSIEGYEYVHHDLATGRERRFPDWQIIHIVEPGPTTQGFGVSRLEAARLTLAIEYAAQRLGAATFANGARPGGIINVKGGLPSGATERAAAVERFKAEVQRRFGGVNRAGLPAVLEGDVTWQGMSHNLDDSAVVDHRQLTRGEVAALFDIPQPAMGILDEANFASVDILHVMFYQDAMSWPIRLIEQAFSRQLIDGVPAYAGQFVEFDLNAVMRGAIESRYRAYATAITTGFKTPNEVRSLENDPPSDQEGADMLLFPLNLSGAVGSQLAEDNGTRDRSAR